MGGGGSPEEWRVWNVRADEVAKKLASDVHEVEARANYMITFDRMEKNLHGLGRGRARALSGRVGLSRLGSPRGLFPESGRFVTHTSGFGIAPGRPGYVPSLKAALRPGNGNKAPALARAKASCGKDTIRCIASRETLQRTKSLFGCAGSMASIPQAELSSRRRFVDSVHQVERCSTFGPSICTPTTGRLWGPSAEWSTRPRMG